MEYPKGYSVKGVKLLLLVFLVQCCSQPIPQLEVCEDPQPVKKVGKQGV